MKQSEVDAEMKRMQKAEVLIIGDKKYIGAVHNEPALSKEECDCGAEKPNCTLGPDCKCDECKKETDFNNSGGADRW